MNFRRVSNQVLETDTITMIGDLDVAIDRNGRAVVRYPYTDEVFNISMFHDKRFATSEQLVMSLEKMGSLSMS